MRPVGIAAGRAAASGGGAGLLPARGEEKRDRDGERDAEGHDDERLPHIDLHAPGGADERLRPGRPDQDRRWNTTLPRSSQVRNVVGVARMPNGPRRVWSLKGNPSCPRAADRLGVRVGYRCGVTAYVQVSPTATWKFSPTRAPPCRTSTR